MTEKTPKHKNGSFSFYLLKNSAVRGDIFISYG